MRKKIIKTDKAKGCVEALTSEASENVLNKWSIKDEYKLLTGIEAYGISPDNIKENLLPHKEANDIYSKIIELEVKNSRYLSKAVDTYLTNSNSKEIFSDDEIMGIEYYLSDSFN